jgi:peptide/nickel transport system permease protein
MPEQSPDDLRLLEPSGNDTELAELIDHDVLLALDAKPIDEEAEGFIKKSLGVGFWIALGWFLFVALFAAIAPFITETPKSGQDNTAPTHTMVSILQHPNTQTNARRDPGGGLYQLPSSNHWLGTDNLGRDQLSRLVWGARVSLPVGFASIALGLLIGSLVGLLAGYLKGRIDNVLMSAMDIILAFPPILLALSIITFTGQKDIGHISLAIGIVAVPAIARLVRANTLTFREREFVLASRTLGSSHGRILAREILPNVLPPVISFSVIGVAVAITAESGLAFIGVTVPLPTATWGSMIQQAATTLEEHPFQVLVPCLVLTFTILSMYFIGDRMRQFLDVKEGGL